MTTPIRNHRSRGEGLIVVIILLAIVGAGTWWLFNHKKQLDRDARTFGHEMIDQLTVKHDINFFADHLGPTTRPNYPPSQLQYAQQKFTEMGVPKQPINIEEQITFESQFFEPRGIFTAHLFYPNGAATLQLAISHPVGKWQIDDMTFTPERPR